MPILDTVFSRRRKVADYRMSICKTCEFLRERGNKCEKCGCFMDYKVMIMSSTCPLNKWGPHNDKE